jgi:hypothetical protein
MWGAHGAMTCVHPAATEFKSRKEGSLMGVKDPDIFMALAELSDELIAQASYIGWIVCSHGGG